MKRRSPIGRVTHVAVPPELVQGVQPSADYTRVSRKLIARQNQRGRPREAVTVEGMGTSRLQLERTRVDPEDLREQERAVAARQQGDQSRALVDALGFEARARAAGAIGRLTPAAEFQLQQREAERSYAYPRTTR